MVVFPLAFYPLAAVSEVIYLILRVLNFQNADKLLTFDTAFFWRAGFFMLLVGLLGHGAAALPGIIDWLNIPNDAPSKDKATFHFIIAILLGGVATFALLLLNWGEPPAQLKFPDDISLLIGVFLNLVVGLMLVNYQGWLGGELVYKHGIGVEQTDDIDPIAVTPGSEALQENR
jgi:uncharacterized membrane protein